MQYREKGLLKIKHRTLVSFAIEALAPHCDALAVSCNRQFNEYQAELDRQHENRGKANNAIKDSWLVADQKLSFQGPVAGIISFLTTLPDSVLAQRDSRTLCIVCSADTPLIDQRVISCLLNASSAFDGVAYHFATQDPERKDPFFPMAFNLFHAIELANQWKSSSQTSNRASQSVKNWLKGFRNAGLHRIPIEDPLTERQFQSANTAQILNSLEADL